MDILGTSVESILLNFLIIIGVYLVILWKSYLFYVPIKDNYDFIMYLYIEIITSVKKQIENDIGNTTRRQPTTQKT